jgi:hypothetical protein
MEEPQEFEVSDRLIAGPIVCPICWDHALEKLEGVRLSARTYAEQPFINRALVYRCSSWHIFAVFEQTL